MDNKILGGALIGVSMVLLILLIVIRSSLVSVVESQIDENIKVTGACHADSLDCPHERLLNMQIPIFIAMAVMIGVISLGVYLILFDKSQKEVAAALARQKRRLLDDERFSILLKGLDPEEKKVIKAVKEQDGITQQTLRLRTDLHKSKLSIVLDGLEKKGLVKRVAKGKTKQVHLKIRV